MNVGCLWLFYGSFSLWDIWGYGPPWIHATVYIAVLVLSALFILRALLPKSSSDGAPVWLFRALMVFTLISSIWHFDDVPRRAEVAVKPLALYDYPVPEITMWIAPPGYTDVRRSKIDFIAEMDWQSYATSQSLEKIPEGSRLNIRLKSSPWSAVLWVHDREKGLHQIPLEQIDDGYYQASYKINEASFWSLRQGSYVLARGHVDTIADDDPVLSEFAQSKPVTNKGLLPLKVKASDDHEITRLALEISPVSDVVKPNITEIYDLDAMPSQKLDDVFYVDVRQSSFAGKQAALSLVIEDAAGQSVRQTLDQLTLPVKDFQNPAALKIAGIRAEIFENDEMLKKFAIDVRQLGSLPGPDHITPAYHMGLRSAYWRLLQAETDEDIAGVQALLWDLAILAEEGVQGHIEPDILMYLGKLTHQLQMQKKADQIKETLQLMDSLFATYINAKTPEELLAEEQLDIRALRHIYNQILKDVRNERYDQAAQMVGLIREALVDQENDFLTFTGYRQYLLASKGRVILGNIIKIQQQLYEQSIDASKSFELASLSPSDLMALQKTKEWQDIQRNQQKLVKSLDDLSTTMARGGLAVSENLKTVSTMARNILNHLDQGDMDNVTRLQSEALVILNNIHHQLQDQNTVSQP